ncbi:MAG: M3 family metallopeptidase, partial [Persephonella sp.]|nr:M3 family metallopeptidase [Persephonella sp.]
WQNLHKAGYKLSFEGACCQKARPQAEKEYEQLNSVCKEKQGLKMTFRPNDFAYYAEKAENSSSNVNDEDYKPYFEKLSDKRSVSPAF